MPYLSPTILKPSVSRSALPILVSFQTRWVEGTVPGRRERLSHVLAWFRSCKSRSPLTPI